MCCTDEAIRQDLVVFPLRLSVIRRMKSGRFVQNQREKVGIYEVTADGYYGQAAFILRQKNSKLMHPFDCKPQCGNRKAHTYFPSS